MKHLSLNIKSCADCPFLRSVPQLALNGIIPWVCMHFKNTIIVDKQGRPLIDLEVEIPIPKSCPLLDV